MNHDERLAVSTAGMRELHAARPAWSLVKELVQNVWDEAPEATLCSVEVGPVINNGAPQRGRTLLTVSDDGPGFGNVRDAWTLMGPTPKRSDPTKRGRFNLGEKEIIAVAVEATVETVAWTVRFPTSGGRSVSRNRRRRGTVITLVMPWGLQAREGLVAMLRRFRPTECRLQVNGEEIPTREPVAARRAALGTVLQDGPGEPLRRTSRQTTIDILAPVHEKAWLYEMGIPVQETDLAWDVDVHQKVPMPPNRDTVSARYLRDVSAEVLNATYDLLDGDDAAATWVRTALEDDRITPEAVTATIQQRYGDRVAIWSSDTDANTRAAESGWQVLHPRSMSADERRHLRELGGLQSTSALFGRSGTVPVESVQPTRTHRMFAEWVRSLAERCGLDATVDFVWSPATIRAACTASTQQPSLLFNTRLLSESWFERRGPEQVELVIHELAHAVADKPMEHGPAWGEACCRVAGQLLAGPATESAAPGPFAATAAPAAARAPAWSREMMIAALAAPRRALPREGPGKGGHGDADGAERVVSEPPEATPPGPRPSFVRVEQCPAAMATPGRGEGYLPVVQLIKHWNRMPWARAAMISGGLPAGTDAVTAAKVAAVVHALCDADGHPVPPWVLEEVSPVETTLVPNIDLGSEFGRALRADAPPACHYHRVYFSVATLEST